MDRCAFNFEWLSCFRISSSAGNGARQTEGGLGILISTQLKVKCTEVAPLKPFAMAVHLSLERGSILFINVYLPPGRKKTEVKEIWVKLERYVSFLVIEYPKARIVLAGDLNARLGPDDPSLEKSSQR